MAVDIRGAKKAKGTEQPKIPTPEKKEQGILDFDENGNVVNKMEEFEGDLVIAGYMEFLGEHGITKEDVQSVFESLITEGNVAWQFKLFDNIPVIFKVRPAWVDDYILTVMDRETSDDERISMARYNNMVAAYNLGASLCQFGEEKYDVNSEEDLEAARNRVRSMSYAIQNMLVKKLAVFDRAIAVATSDWAVKNFTKPRQEKSGQK